MKTKKPTKGSIESYRKIVDESMPQLSINCVIFRYYDKKLQYAAVQFTGSKMQVIPGGYIFQNESIDDAARRNLYEQTNMDDLILHQFGSFGSHNRRITASNSDIENIGIPEDFRNWMEQRFVTIAYYSIISDPNTEIIANAPYSNADWLDIEGKDRLAMDHSEIVGQARKALARDLLSRPVLLSFMPACFTIPELQKLHEAILGRSVDRGNFRKRVLKSGFLVKTGLVKENTGQRPPELYQINKERYLTSLTEDVKLGF